jgi:HSP20 family protein
MKRKGELMHIGDLTEEILSQVNRPVQDKFIPKANVWESNTAYIIYMYIPGVEMEEINLEFVDNQIVVAGERKSAFDPDNNTIRLQEIEFGTFQRRIRLNDLADKDKISAQFENGVLKISIQKRNAENAIIHTKVA